MPSGNRARRADGGMATFFLFSFLMKVSFPRSTDRTEPSLTANAVPAAAVWRASHCIVLLINSVTAVAELFLDSAELTVLIL